MSARHIEQHYGFGAARIAIRSEMHRVSRGGFREDLDAMLAEAGGGGPVAVVRRFAGSGLGILAILGMIGFVIAGLASQEAERQALEVVMLESTPPVVPPMVELPVEPDPILAEPVVPEPVVPEPAPPEPPPMVAELEPPPPPPPAAKPEPEPVRVKPEIAKIEPPPVVPAPRLERAVRERPQPIEKPRVQIEAVAVAPDRSAPAPQPERIARNAVRPDTRTMPRMAAPAAPAIDLPRDAAPERTFRVAAARAPTAPRGRPIAGVAPAGMPAPAMDVPATRSTPTRGAAAPRPGPAASGARPAPRIEMAAAPVSPAPRAAAVPQVVARAERAVPPPGSGSGGGSSPRPGLSGVPLGDLAACVTDREEDRLKQAVVAAVKTQGECVSSKGVYRFVETKNLNAFLMWIDRAPSRRVEDRCAELRYALECLQGGGRHASR